MEKFEFYQQMLNNIRDGVYYVNPQREIIFWNKGAERITGYQAEEVVNQFCYNNILRHVDEFGNQLCFNGCPLSATIADGQVREAKVYLHHKLGHRVPVMVYAMAIYDGEQIIGAVETFSDITESDQIRQSLEEFKSLAMIDQLTQVANRRHVDAFLLSKYNEYKALDLQFGLIFIDIDHFKTVNDEYGHKFGDEVLKVVAHTCQALLRTTDLFGRFGGEEFVAVMVGIDEEKILKKANEMRMLVESLQLEYHGLPVKVTISLGATIILPSDDLTSLINRADQMMYHSKQTGRNKVTCG
jgi:diguanylate cyclase (GGDEF)-like protein/PAS domain S-box-containing protein